jgi:hypothetical protein
MPHPNVFRFVWVRAPEYHRPEPEPDPAILTLHGGTVPVPAVSPNDEVRFRALVREGAAAGAPNPLRRAAESVIRSEWYFGRGPRWRRLLAVEPACREVINRHGPMLPLATNTPWYQAVDRLLAPFTEDIRGDLWLSLYARTALGEHRHPDRTRIMFWLRLFTAMARAATTLDPSRSLDFGALRISVPGGIAPVVRNTRSPVTGGADPAGREATRTARRAELSSQIASLEAVGGFLDTFVPAPAESRPQQPPQPAGREPVTVRLQLPVRPSRQRTVRAEEPESAFLLKAGDLPYEMAETLRRHHIVFEHRLTDDVRADVDDVLASLEEEYVALGRRRALVLRDGVLVRRLVELD